MKNPKTTIAGYLLIAGAVIYGVAQFLLTGHFDGESAKAILAAVGGSGLIAASDGGH